MTTNHIDSVKEYALIRTSMHTGYRGDSIRNSEEYAYRIGRDFPGDAAAIVQSLSDSENEYSLLTGLSPRGIQVMAREIKRGAKAGFADAKSDGRT